MSSCTLGFFHWSKAGGFLSSSDAFGSSLSTGESLFSDGVSSYELAIRHMLSMSFNIVIWMAIDKGCARCFTVFPRHTSSLSTSDSLWIVKRACEQKQ